MLKKVSKAEFEQFIATPNLVVAERINRIGHNHIQRHVIDNEGHIIAAQILNDVGKCKETFILANRLH